MSDNKKKTGQFLLMDTFTVQQIQPCLTCAMSYQLNYSGEKKVGKCLENYGKFSLHFSKCII